MVTSWPITENVEPANWELTSGLDLNQYAADFYILYWLSLDGLDDGLFEENVGYLADEFSRYTDMACGGEFRHIGWCWNGRTKVQQEIIDGLIQPKRHGNPVDRKEFWSRWFWFRKAHGTAALEWIHDAFKGIRQKGYGGRNWAEITQMLILYEQLKLSPTAFVDFCFGLQHNNGSYFNKANYDLDGYRLRLSLTQARDSTLDRLVKSTSPHISDIFEKRKNESTIGYTKV